MVEFALIVPIALLLLAGTVDMGRAIYFAVQLANASEQGARLAVLPDRICNTLVGKPTACSGSGSTGQTVCGGIAAALPGIPSSVIQCSENGTLSPGAAPSGVAYVEIDQFTSYNSSDPCSASGGTSTTATPRALGNLPIRVQIDYYYRPITPLVSTLFPSSFHLHSEACGRAEY